MGTVNDAIFANKLGHFYQDIAQDLGDFVHTHIGTLSREDIATLSDGQTRVINYANQFFSLSDKIAFEQSESYFNGVSNAIDSYDKAIKEIHDINRVIIISTGVISLALAIVSQNGGGILSSVQTIAGAVKG
ncbi:MAG TPA: hypothetical protein VNS58_24715 [Puia sp.]|nr:hypothetical protein [Puia sp.]